MNTNRGVSFGPGSDSRANLDRFPANRFSNRLILPRSAHWHELISDVRDLLTVRAPTVAMASHAAVLKDENFSRSQVASFALHGGLALLLLFVTFAPQRPTQPKPKPDFGQFFAPSPYVLHKIILPPGLDGGHEGGSGGERSLLPPTVGRRPPFSATQIVAPSVHVFPNSVVLLPPTIVGPDHVKLPNSDLQNWGIIDEKALTNSDGPGCCSGIGNNKGSGDGHGKGPGFEDGAGNTGCCGNGQGGVGKAARLPECLYCPRPEYSDQARKSHYQGSVLLNVQILANGKAGSIEVAKGLGMGLDEKAIEAVKTWQFKPAIGQDAKPFVLVVPVEVVFQLY